MDFVQKSNFLLFLFFTEIMSEKSFLNILNKTQSFLDQKNWSFNKDQKMDFF